MTAGTCRRLPAPEWPRGLNHLRPRPRELFLSGRLPNRAGVAIVGTRHASEGGIAFATALASELVRAGVPILSGGAQGIDAAAHRGALEAGGVTLVVAPAGIDRPFPPEHQELFRAVVESGGGYLSLCAAHVPACRARFFLRNACLVALSHAVVVVEAGVRSGARNAAKHARVLGRKLFVVPSAPWLSTGHGCIAELRAGAALLESAQDVLGYLAQGPAGGNGQLGLALGQVGATASASRPASSPVLDAVRAGATTADAICQATGLAPGDVQRQVLELRLTGLLGQDPTGALFPLRP